MLLIPIRLAPRGAVHTGVAVRTDLIRVVGRFIGVVVRGDNRTG